MRDKKKGGKKKSGSTGDSAGASTAPSSSSSSSQQSQSHYSTGKIMRFKPSPPFGLALETLRHSSNQSTTLKRYHQLCQRVQLLRGQKSSDRDNDSDNDDRDIESDDHTSRSGDIDDEEELIWLREENEELRQANLHLHLLNHVQYDGADLYERCIKLTKNKYIGILVSMLAKRPLFCPHQFHYYFYHFQFREPSNARRSLRKIVMIETIQAFGRCKYHIVSQDGDEWARRYWQRKERSMSLVYHKRTDNDDDDDGDDDTSDHDKDYGDDEDNDNDDDDDELIEEEGVDRASTTSTVGSSVGGTTMLTDDDGDEEENARLSTTIPQVISVALNWNNLVANVRATTMFEGESFSESQLSMRDAKKKSGKKKHGAEEAPKAKKNKRGKRRGSEDSDDEDEVAESAVAQSSLVQQKKPTKRFARTDVHVVHGDCLSTAIELKRRFRLNPVMLVMASSSHPGGGYRTGSGAQEEEISRRSQLYMCLDDPYQLDAGRPWTYPLPEMGGIYIPRCTVIRDSEQAGYAFLDKPIDISMLAMSTYSNPPVEKQKVSDGGSSSNSGSSGGGGDDQNDTRASSVISAGGDNGNSDHQDDDDDDDGEWRFSGKFALRVLQKIRVLFDAAIERRHDSLVLSAWGSGVYSNPARHMAELFKQVLNEPAYAGAFRLVVFSILDDVNSRKNPTNPNGNVLPFHEVFHGKAKSIDCVSSLDQFVAQWSKAAAATSNMPDVR